jgi:hypothetical protein
MYERVTKCVRLAAGYAVLVAKSRGELEASGAAMLAGMLYMPKAGFVALLKANREQYPNFKDACWAFVAPFPREAPQPDGAATVKVRPSEVFRRLTVTCVTRARELGLTEIGTCLYFLVALELKCECLQSFLANAKISDPELQAMILRALTANDPVCAEP